MKETFVATLNPMLLMFACMLIGYVANKCRLLPHSTSTVLSKLETSFLVPALIIKTFLQYCTVQSIAASYKLILYCAVAVAVALLIALPLSKAFSKDDAYRRNIYKYALAIGNFSFMGTAIVPMILGEEVLYGYMLYILPLNVLVYTWGMFILIPEGKRSGHPLKNLLNPVFLSILIGAALGLLGVQVYLPQFVTATLDSCAACMGPLAMILTGFVIGRYKFTSLVTNLRVYIATALRLIVFPVLFVALLWAIGADNDTLVFTLFAFGTPLGLNTVVFPAAFGGDTSTGASMAMVSHTLCIVTIPVLYALLQVVLASV